MNINALVVFYSRYGKTEKLALAAGVGAIQARANIRLRRLADLGDLETIQSDPKWIENRERMKKDYIAPREVDTQWADVLILAAPHDCLAEMERYLDALPASVRGKMAAVVGEFSASAVRAGLNVVAPPNTLEDASSALAYGHLAIETARLEKQARASSSDIANTSKQ